MEVEIDFILIMNARKKHNITLSDYEVKTVWKKILFWFSKESEGGKGSTWHITFYEIYGSFRFFS